MVEKKPYNRSEAMKKRWTENSLFRKTISEKAKKNWDNGNTVSRKGCKASESSKLLMSASAKQKFATHPELKDAIRFAQTGRKHSLNEKLKRNESRKKFYELHPEAKEAKDNKARISNADPIVRKKISDALKGRKKSPEHIENAAKALRAKWSNPEYRARMVAVNNTEYIKKVRSENSSGSRNAGWLGGVSKLPYSWDFNKSLKRNIRERDGYRCVVCGQTTDLAIHHIDYDKMNSSPKNLVTVCRGDNAKANFRKEEYMSLLREYIKSIYIE